MKPETGNNNQPLKNEVSIQLKLGGHNFSVDTLPTDIKGDISFVVDTRKVTLVPKEAFDESLAEQYLAVAGLSCNENESAVWSDPQRDIVAIAAIADTTLKLLADRFGKRARFTSPLLSDTHDEGCNIYIQVTDDTAYFRVFDRSLLRAEAVGITSDDDILYYAKSFVSVLKPGMDITLYFKGNGSAAKLLKRYFKTVICE